MQIGHPLEALLRFLFCPFAALRSHNGDCEEQMFQSGYGPGVPNRGTEVVDTAGVTRVGENGSKQTVRVSSWLALTLCSGSLGGFLAQVYVILLSRHPPTRAAEVGEGDGDEGGGGRSLGLRDGRSGRLGRSAAFTAFQIRRTTAAHHVKRLKATSEASKNLYGFRTLDRVVSGGTRPRGSRTRL